MADLTSKDLKQGSNKTEEMKSTTGPATARNLGTGELKSTTGPVITHNVGGAQTEELKSRTADDTPGQESVTRRNRTLHDATTGKVISRTGEASDASPDAIAEAGDRLKENASKRGQTGSPIAADQVGGPSDPRYTQVGEEALRQNINSTEISGDVNHDKVMK